MLPLLDVLTPIINKVLDYIPDPQKRAEAQAAAIKATQDHEKDILSILASVDVEQSKINAVDAASSDWFKSYARPAAMWISVIGLAWTVIPVIVGQFFVWFGHPAPTVVELPSFVVNTLLYGLLGLGAYRSIDKKNGVA